MRYRFLFSGLLLLAACEGSSPANIELKNDSSGTIAKTNDWDSTIQKIEAENSRLIAESGNDVTKVYISRSDSAMFLVANKRLDHRVFGYADADTRSERLLVISVFTTDVKDNPFKCKLGAYYHSGAIEDFELYYLATFGDYIKAVAIDKKTKRKTFVYFEKKWVEFSNY